MTPVVCQTSNPIMVDQIPAIRKGAAASGNRSSKATTIKINTRSSQLTPIVFVQNAQPSGSSPRQCRTNQFGFRSSAPMADLERGRISDAQARPLSDSGKGGAPVAQA